MLTNRRPFSGAESGNGWWKSVHRGHQTFVWKWSGRRRKGHPSYSRTYYRLRFWLPGSLAEPLVFTSLSSY